MRFSTLTVLKLDSCEGINLASMAAIANSHMLEVSSLLNFSTCNLWYIICYPLASKKVFNLLLDLPIGFGDQELQSVNHHVIGALAIDDAETALLPQVCILKHHFAHNNCWFH